MVRKPLLALASVALVLGIGCSGGDDADPTPTSTPAPPSATSELRPTATRGPAPSPTPTTDEVASIVWLVGIAPAQVMTLIEDTESYPFQISFAPHGAPVVSFWRDGPVQVTYGLDGAFLGESADQAPCLQAEDDAVVNGRTYVDVNCGTISPDGSLMTYGVFINDQRMVWDQFVLNLATDERTLIQAGLNHCGGCDFRFGPGWSPTGRFVYFPEFGGEGRVFLTDTTGFTTRELTRGPAAIQSTFEPRWAPGRDFLLRPGESGGSLLEDVATGSITELDHVPWPSRFDPSGRLIYSPAWSEGKEAPEGQTEVFDAETGTALASLDGTPPYDALFTLDPAVIGIVDGFVAALIGAGDCQGVNLYNSAGAVTFVQSGVGPVLSPDGSAVALFRPIGQTGPVKAPGIESISMTRFELLVVDVASGAERVIASGAISQDPPKLVWNQAGTHLLVQWPFWGYF